MKLRSYFDRHKRIAIVYLFFIVTCMVYIPLVNYITNVSEYRVSLMQLLPVILLGTVGSIILFYVLDFVLYRGVLEKPFYGIVCAISIATYIQYNFLNPKFPELDGTRLDWDVYHDNLVISTIVWILLLLCCVLMEIFFSNTFERISAYISGFLALVQIVSLVILFITTPRPGDGFAFSKKDEFELGKKENIVVFCIDSLEYNMVQDYLNSEDYLEGEFDDFQFFYHAISGGGTTRLGVQTLLTGSDYDPMQSMEEYAKLAWQDTLLYDDLHEEGYDVRLFIDMYDTLLCSNGKVDNFDEAKYEVVSYKELFRGMYELSEFLALPQCIKPLVIPDITKVTGSISSTGYEEDDYQFCLDLLENGLSIDDYDKTFRYYHLWGAHVPGYLDKNLNPIERESGDYNTYDQMCADFKIIREYIWELKQLGIYDNTMIVITGDHGQHNFGSTKARAGVLIKNMDEHHELIVNPNPISLKNVYSSFALNAMGEYSKYGLAVKDIDWDHNIDALRYHSIAESTVENMGDALDKRTPYPGARFFCTQWEDGGISFDEWNPYSINRIEYHLGDLISFNSDKATEYEITEQVIKEEDYITAGSELNFCFNIEDKVENESLDLTMDVSSICGDEQRMFVYANGNRVDTHVFAGKDAYKVNIPAELLDEDNNLIFRFVFPGANTPHQLDETSDDWRVKSISIDSIVLE